MSEGDKNRWTEGWKNAGDQMKNAGQRMAEQNRQLNMRLIEQAEENAREVFNALREAAQAKSLKDVTEVQTRFLREQGKRGMDQLREIGDLIARFGREAVAPAAAEAQGTQPDSGQSGEASAGAEVQQPKDGDGPAAPTP